ncbi:MAG TPA: zinc ribbon domain-containing protein [Candidatus Sulfotelmatobacter sp.]|nr:zinc ribbon domain-containing protein [Candidatus Sulfotelmatobacter sp.]
MAIAQTIRCSNCGAPVEFRPGELVATCKYCGFTTVIETGQPFVFEHSLILNHFDQTQIDKPIRDWMESGFLKPGDLARKAKITEKELIYLPFWVVSIIAKTTYKGIFERVAPPVVKDGTLEKEYNWLVLAREASDFPTREYDVPLEGKIPYDFRKIEGFAKILNSEIEREEALELAKQQIDASHRFLLQQDVDKIIDMKSEFTLEQMVYLHAPIWFIKYEYKGKIYQIIVDGTEGMALKGDIPPAKFGLL